MLKKIDKKLSVAPMMDWTDRHCRYLHRVISQNTLLYTEMVTATAITRGDSARLLAFHPAEHPLALQLGGADPEELAAATRIACGLGFDEINLNVGCPSDRVQSGLFGAVLMKNPGLVGDCVQAMIEAAGGIEVTVKCRIGVDDQDPHDTLPRFIEAVAERGVNTFAIHARKAWLQGLSPKENRQVPPLDHALVVDMKHWFPALQIVINGGITTLGMVEELLSQGVDGAMLGRAAYHDPYRVLGDADRRLFGGARRKSALGIVEEMLPYIEAHLAAGGRLAQVTRHMLGLFNGRAGARQWRRILSEDSHKPGASTDVVLRAVAEIHGPEDAADQPLAPV